MKDKSITPKFRIYALIIGETLPEGKILGSEIKKMDFAVQEKRKFAPIQGVFSKDKDLEYGKTYATYLPYVDPIKIRSEYVVIHEIEEDKPGSALGGAIRAIDQLCRFLSIAGFEDIKRKFGRDHGAFQPYIYQVNKIYQLDQQGKESEVDFELKSGLIYLPKRPEFNEWRGKGIPEFLEEISSFQDDTLQRALKYLYRSSIGNFLLDSREKIALDHIKSIEIILDELSNKRDFKDQLEEAGNKIGLTSEEKKRITEFWADRSKYGDVAHVSPYDNTERYPNQFPIPSNVQYSGGAFDSVAASVCVKYFYYKKSFIIIEIMTPDKNSDKEGTFGAIYRMWPESNGPSLYFLTNENNKIKLKKIVKNAYAKKLNIDEADIIDTVVGQGKKSVTLRLKSEI